MWCTHVSGVVSDGERAVPAVWRLDVVRMLRELLGQLVDQRLVRTLRGENVIF